MNDSETLVELTQMLLSAIAAGDWDVYADLCDPSMTAFEPEALGHLVSGLAFHEYYFNLPRGKSPVLNTISQPHVRIINEIGIICYIRLVQRLDSAGNPVSSATEETRVWQKMAGRWKHIHFHRSPAAKA